MNSETTEPGKPWQRYLYRTHRGALGASGVFEAIAVVILIGGALIAYEYALWLHRHTSATPGQITGIVLGIVAVTVIYASVSAFFGYVLSLLVDIENNSGKRPSTCDAGMSLLRSVGTSSTRGEEWSVSRSLPRACILPGVSHGDQVARATLGRARRPRGRDDGRDRRDQATSSSTRRTSPEDVSPERKARGPVDPEMSDSVSRGV